WIVTVAAGTIGWPERTSFTTVAARREPDRTSVGAPGRAAISLRGHEQIERGESGARFGDARIATSGCAIRELDKVVHAHPVREGGDDAVESRRHQPFVHVDADVDAACSEVEAERHGNRLKVRHGTVLGRRRRARRTFALDLS